MKTLKDKRTITKCNIGKPDYIYWEKDIKQAIKDLKEAVNTYYNRSIYKNLMIKEVHRIFGVWE